MYTEADIRTAFLRGACFIVRGYRRDGDVPSRVDAEVAADAYVTTLAPAPAPEPKRKSTRKPKEERPAGWGDAAWEFYLACKGANTYATADPKSIARRAQAALDRKEELRPNPTFRVRFYYASTQPQRDGKKLLPPAVDAASVALGKLGVSADAMRVETLEEVEAARRENERRTHLLHTLKLNLPEEGASWRARLEPNLSALDRVRITALESLLAGEREEAKDLLRKVRAAEARLREYFGVAQLRTAFPESYTRRYGGRLRLADILRAQQRRIAA